MNYAILGCGYWGSILMRNAQLAGLECKMVYDPSKEARDRAKQNYKDVIIAESIDEVKNSDVDLVFIATPALSHYELAVEFLNAGKNLFVEKPLCIEASQVAVLENLMEQSGVALHCDLEFAYAKYALKAVEIVKSGVLGEILQINAIRNNLGGFQCDINIIYDLFLHDFSLLYRMFGSFDIANLQLIKSSIPIANIPKSSDAKAFFNLKNQDFDIPLSIEASYLSGTKIRQLHIIGEKAILVIDDLLPVNKISVYENNNFKVGRNLEIDLSYEDELSVVSSIKSFIYKAKTLDLSVIKDDLKMVENGIYLSQKLS